MAHNIVFGKNILAHVGDTVVIQEMLFEPQYSGQIGVVTKIDEVGQLYGTWGSCTLTPNIDKFTVIP